MKLIATMCALLTAHARVPGCPLARLRGGQATNIDAVRPRRGPRAAVWQPCRAVPSALLACILGTPAPAAVGVQDGAAVAGSKGLSSVERYLFDQQITETLDPRRLAVYAPAAASAELSVLLDDLGIEAREVERWPIDGWWLVRLAPGQQQSPVRLVRRAAADARIGFASPVLIGADGGPVLITPDILVGFRRDTTPEHVEAVLRDVPSAPIVERDFGGMPVTYRLRARTRDGLEALALANTLAQRDDVLFAEPDWIFTGRGGYIPNDPGFPDCWGLHNTGQTGGVADMDMDAPEAWDITAGDPSVIVVVIDTGVQPDHPDIHQIPGADFTLQGGDGGPVNGCDNHGTPVAGCVSATINNGIGTVGVAPGCVSASARTFISSNACNGSWSSQASWTVNALDWALGIGARITNNSNGYGFTSAAIEQMYADTRAAGLVHFAAAGNNSSALLAYPARLPSVNAIAALNHFGQRASFSNYGNGLAFSAPGVSIYSTDRTGAQGYAADDYAFVYGTSFASPYAAGVAALALSRDASLTAPQVEALLQQSSMDLGAPGYDTGYGWGFVNAAAAVACPPDFNNDGAVNSQDFIAFLNAFSAGDPSADFNGDGAIDSQDFIAFLNAFVVGC